MRQILGIVGGMGVMASAEFTKTVYECNSADIEQDSPAVILLSDPVFPDRTQAFLSGSYAPLLAATEKSLNQLAELGVSKVVLACVTLHFTIPMLPEGLRRRIISLVEVALTNVIASGQKQLLFCSSGTRAAKVFERHAKWAEAKDYIVWPDEQDQNLVHSLLYQYKTNSEEQPFLLYLNDLLKKYEVNSFVAGCSELHMLTKHLARHHTNIRFIDPLQYIARNLYSFMEETASDHPLTGSVLTH